MNDKYQYYLKVPAFLISLFLLIFGIVIAKNILYPIAFGILLGYLMFPLTNFFERKGLTRIIAILLSIIAFSVIFVVTMFFIFKQIDQLFRDFPDLKKQALFNVEVLIRSIENAFNIKEHELEVILKDNVANMFETGLHKYQNIIKTTTSTVFTFSIMPVYIFLFLYYRTKLANFIIKVVPGIRKISIIGMLRDISLVTSRYLLGLLLVVLFLCFLTSLGLYIIGVSHAIIIGVLWSLFGFIPYFGTLIGAFIPLVFALLTMSSPVYALKIVVLYFIIHFIENNILSPNIVGNRLKLNPLVIILGLIIASSIWGIPGLLVTVPFIAILRIVFSYYEKLQPWAFLFGDTGTASHAITVAKIKKFISKKRKNNKKE